MMKAIVIFSAMLSVSGCSQSDMKSNNADIVSKQVGRFTIIPAAEGYPPMVLDTASGCVMAFAKDKPSEVTIYETSFADGTNSCRVSKQLLVIETESRIKK